MRITVKKFEKNLPLMKDVPSGYLVKTEKGVHAITEGGGAFLLNRSNSDPWFNKAVRLTTEPVTVIGKIKGITFDIE